MRTYAWGSRTAIAEFTGRPSPDSASRGRALVRRPSGRPGVAGDRRRSETSLLDAVRADPEGQLGAAVRARFGDALPFLVKVLAADEPLSLQAHPSAEQAVEGFAREDRLGIPVSAADPQLPRPQPQARTAGGARRSSRRSPVSGPRPQSAELMRALAVPALDPLRRTCCPGSPTPTACARCSPPGSPRRSPISTCWCPRCSTGAINYMRSGATEFAAEAKTVLELGERYPGDAGVLASLLLNRITLQPGEAIYPAGRQPAQPTCTVWASR